MTRADPTQRPAPTYSESLVLTALMNGSNAVEIGEALALSPHTVRHHITRLRHRYGARHMVGLVAAAWRERHDALEARLAECERVRAALDRRGRGV